MGIGNAMKGRKIGKDVVVNLSKITVAKDFLPLETLMLAWACIGLKC